MNNRPHPDIIMLAAGLGTRMQPLTEKTPKPLVQVAGKPLIDWVIGNFQTEQCTRFVINAHHHLDQMQDYIRELTARFPKSGFFISEESDVLLNTGGGAKKALTLTRSDPVLISNADSFWRPGGDQPLARMRAQFEAGAEMVLLCVQPGRAVGFRRSHDFCLAPDKQITNDRGLPVIYAGVALLSRNSLDAAPADAFSLADLFFAAQDRGTLHGILLNTDWLHIGDVAAIKEAETYLAGLGA